MAGPLLKSHLEIPQLDSTENIFISTGIARILPFPQEYSRVDRKPWHQPTASTHGLHPRPPPTASTHVIIFPEIQLNQESCRIVWVLFSFFFFFWNFRVPVFLTHGSRADPATVHGPQDCITSLQWRIVSHRRKRRGGYSRNLQINLQ